MGESIFSSRFDEIPSQRAAQFAADRGMTITDNHAGSGNDGSLFTTNHQTILKVFARHAGYQMERDVYFRLMGHEVVEVKGFAVPWLVDFDDALGVIEMTLVEPPFLLDFAKAQLDVAWQDTWPEEVMQERWAYWRDLFEPHQWPRVKAITNELAHRFGIYLLDLHPGNIRFADSAAT